MPIIDRTPKMRDVIINEGDLVQGTSNGGEVRLPIGPVAGRIRRKLGDNKLSYDTSPHLNIRDYGAVGDGVTDDTVAIAACFSDSDLLSIPVMVPPGTYLTGTIDYRMQSVFGVQTDKSIIKGKPGLDVFNVNATVGQFYRQNGDFAYLTILVDDTVDNTAAFPNRGGVGNAGYANDYNDKNLAAPPSCINWHHHHLHFKSTSTTVGGRNGSCGIYTQSNHFSQNLMSNICFSYMAYGWRDHYPLLHFTPYVTSFSRDHCQVDFLHFLRCGYQWTVYGWGVGDVANVMFHGGPSIVDLDCDWNYMHIAGWEMVGNATAGGNFLTSSRNYKNTYESVTTSSNAMIVWNESDSSYSGNINVTVALPWLQITGHRNRFHLTQLDAAATSYGYGFVQDLGIGNVVESGERGSSALNFRRWSLVPDGRVGRKRDSHSPLLGYVDPPFISSDDLFINPRMLRITGAIPSAFDYITDATADFGVVIRRTVAGGSFTFDNNNLNEIDGFKVGNFLPAGKVRVYIKHRAATTGTLTWTLQAPIGTTRGSITSSTILSTGWTVVWFDADLSAVVSTDTMRLVSGAVGGGGSGPIDLAYVMFRPWAKDFPVADQAMGADVGDAAKTLTAWTDNWKQVWATPLTANRAVTLSTTKAQNGDTFRITRTAAATGAFTLNVGTGPLRSLYPGEWVEVTYNGNTSAWMVSEAGVVGTTVTIDGALDHNGTTVGFYGIAPVTRPTAYTQTAYTNADKTIAALTAAVLTHAFGTADGTVDDVGAAFNQATLNNNFKELTTQVANLLADITDVKQALNSVIDDLQSLGLAQ